MDKKTRLTIKLALLGLVGVMLFPRNVFSQKRYDYQPMTNQQKQDIDNTIFNDDVASMLSTNAIPIGPVSITDVLNMVSYNPIEGTRMRISLMTNNIFSKRLALSGMIAYGTKDNKIKYGIGAAYNFAPKSKGVYAFPCSTISVDYSSNTFMPSSPNYDVAYFSFGEWDRFYFGKRKRLMASFLQQFKMGFAFEPYFQFQKIDDYILYDAGNMIEMLNPVYDYTNTSYGIEVAFIPQKRQKTSLGQVATLLNNFNSRYYSFPTKISANYSYNEQKYEQTYYYQKLEIMAQGRLLFKPIAFDARITAGKIFGESDGFMYFTPNYRTSAVSNMFGFNLYCPYELAYKEYIQTYTQVNLGGLLLDNIEFFKKFRPNEFINFKALFTQNEDVYAEAGAGIDHIFGFLGLEVVKRIANKNPYDMPEWAVRVRCTL